MIVVKKLDAEEQAVQVTRVSNILHADLSTLVIDVEYVATNEAARVTAERSFGKTLALRISTDGDCKRRHIMEHRASKLAGVVPILLMQYMVDGLMLRRLFHSDAAYSEFIAKIKQDPIHKTTISRLIAKFASGNPVLVTWCRIMQGDVSSLPVAIRAQLRPQLLHLFENTLKHEAKRQFGRFLLHGDLRLRNVLYTVNDDDGRYELFLTDFGASSLVKVADEHLVDAEIKSEMANLENPSTAGLSRNSSVLGKRARPAKL